MPVRYAALYEKGTGIQYYGEVVSWRKAERNTLPGNGSSTGEYHVFDILKWKKLPAIVSKAEAGPNPIAYTNYFLLTASTSYPELRLRSEEEFRLFTELKRCVDAAIIESEDHSIEFNFGAVKLFVKDDEIITVSNDRIIDRRPTAEFRKKPGLSFRNIYIKIQSE